MIGWHCVDTTVQVQEKKKKKKAGMVKYLLLERAGGIRWIEGWVE